MGHILVALRAIGAWLLAHAEDLSLALGAALFSGGVGLALGGPYGLATLGALLIAYGVWITPRRRR